MTADLATTGVTGHPWRADVTPWGAIRPWDGSPPLDWHVAADDRWHSPERETTVRQRRIDGTAVFETRMRIPDGDVVQRIYSVADHGGLTMIDLENESPLPIAVALTRRHLLTNRPPTSVPIEGIDLPSESTIVVPVGHRSSVTVALSHAGAGPGQLPSGLPPAEQVANGWQALLDQASRFELPDVGVAAAASAARCEAILAGPPGLDDDPVGVVLTIAEMVRMGDRPEPWIAELADAIATIGPLDGWDVAAALGLAGVVLARAGEWRAVDDVQRIVDGRAPSPLPTDPPDGIRAVAWLERTLAIGGDLLPAGIPQDWLGANFEVFGVPTGPTSAVSFAVRWHGDRPAVLWEQTGDPRTLRATRVAPGWSTADVRGEALWPAP